MTRRPKMTTRVEAVPIQPEEAATRLEQFYDALFEIAGKVVDANQQAVRGREELPPGEPVRP